MKTTKCAECLYGSVKDFNCDYKFCPVYDFIKCNESLKNKNNQLIEWKKKKN
jgi:hypothetical protein